MRKLESTILHKWRPVISYLAVGITAVVIYFAALAVLLELAKMDYRLAVTLAYFPSVTFSFYANKYLTFSSRSRADTIRQMVRFSMVTGINYLLTMVIVTLAVEQLHWAPYVGALIATVTCAFIGYTVSKYWIFKKEGLA